MLRAAVFALVGAVFMAHWVIADPGYEASASQSEWSYVLLFSAAIAGLAVALPLYGRLVGGRIVLRWSLVAAAGAALASLSNIVEDGLQMDWAFFAFVLSTAIVLFGLVALTVVIASRGRGGYRLLALVPAATLLALLLYVAAGGPLMLAAWLAAAVVAVALPARTAAVVTS